MAETETERKRLASDVPQELLDIINRVDWGAIDSKKREHLRKQVEFFLTRTNILPLKPLRLS